MNTVTSIILCLALGALVALFSIPSARATARTAFTALQLKWQIPALSMRMAYNAATDLAPAEHVFDLYPEQAIAANLVVKRGSTGAGYYDVCGAGDEPIGVTEDASESTTLARTRAIFNANYRRPVVLTGNAAIAQDAKVYTAASGKVGVEPTAAGTVWWVGIARTACAGDGKKFVVQLVPPTKLTVIAAATSTNGTAAAASASLANLAAESEKIGDDVRGIFAALTAGATHLKIATT